MSHPTVTADVAVVGGGIIGLATAERLTAAGLSVAVLEARDRVGGRTWTDTVDGAVLEIGGQWVSPDQTVLLDLLDELGLKTYSRYRDGESVYIGADGRPKPWLAESWSVDKDGREVTFQIRRGVSFTDGTPVDAEAVRYSLDRFMKLSKQKSNLGPLEKVEVVRS